MTFNEKFTASQHRAHDQAIATKILKELSELRANADASPVASSIQGQTRLRISIGRLREIHVPSPPIPLQRRFAAHLNAIYRAKAVHLSTLAKADALFATLQDHCFRGSR